MQRFNFPGPETEATASRERAPDPILARVAGCGDHRLEVTRLRIGEGRGALAFRAERNRPARTNSRRLGALDQDRPHRRSVGPDQPERQRDEFINARRHCSQIEVFQNDDVGRAQCMMER